MASSLHSPFRLGSLELPSRIALAPMTRNRAKPGFVPHELNALYYRQRATAGLLITEASQISQQGQGYPNTPGIYTPEQIEGWKLVTQAVHEEGGRIFLQLWHVGRASHQDFQPDGQLPVAPSAISIGGQLYTHQGKKDYPTPRALEIEELPGIVASYAQGAKNAKEAGFDGVEIHGANGYLLDQFLRDGANKRTDAYGGSIENRARLLLEVTEAVVGVFGADRVAVRLSPLSAFNGMSDSQPEQTFPRVAEMLNTFGLAYLHVIDPVSAANPPSQLQLTPLMRKAFQGPLMGNEGYDAQLANEAIDAGLLDLVSFGKSFLANPDLPRRLELGAELNPFDFSTFYGGTEKGYTDYPALTEA